MADGTVLDEAPRSVDAWRVDHMTARQRALWALEAEHLEEALEHVQQAAVQGGRDGLTHGTPARQAAEHELSLVWHVAPGVVLSRLALARRVRAGLPEVWDAFLRGDFGLWHLQKVDEQTKRLVQPGSREQLDHAIADYAAHHTATQLNQWLRRRVERLEADASAARHRRARAERHVRITRADDGMAWLSVFMTEVDASAIGTRIDTEARALGSGDDRTHDQRCSDLARDLLLGPADAQAGPHVAIGVTVPFTSLAGLDDAPGEMADRTGTVPAQLIREKAVEPGTVFYRLLTDEHGHLLDTTYLGRFAPHQVRTALWFRDGTSGFPTSTVSAERCDAEHAEAWPAPTHGQNLYPLHRTAHRLKTAGFLHVRRTELGELVWTTRTGHQYRHTPDPLPVEQWPVIQPMARTG